MPTDFFLCFLVYFYPRSPCGERLTLQFMRARTVAISIHALLAESDRPMPCPLYHQQYFYPRSPCGERPPSQHQCVRNNHISIHALLAESDSATFSGSANCSNFYPRSPCGERLKFDTLTTHITHFYPRSPCGERRKIKDFVYLYNFISIHALLAESDHHFLQFVNMQYVFLSTLSLRRATAKVHKTVGHFCAYETTFMGIASSC